MIFQANWINSFQLSYDSPSYLLDQVHDCNLSMVLERLVQTPCCVISAAINLKQTQLNLPLLMLGKVEFYYLGT